MSEHRPHLSEDMLRGLPSQVSRIAQAVLLSIGIASTGVSIAGEWYHGQHFLSDWLLRNVDVLGAVLHIILITLVLFPGRIKALNDEVSDPIVRGVIRCINSFCLGAWRWFWGFLGLLYITLLFTLLIANTTHHVELGRYTTVAAALPAAFIDVFSIGSTMFLILLYKALTPAFLRRVAHRLARWREDQPNPLRWQSWRSIVAILGGGAVVAVMVFGFRMTIYGRPVPGESELYLSLLIGVAAAVSLAYFAGRLDSMFLFNWQWLIPILFLYACIQVYSAVLYQPDIYRKAILIYSAFTMKCVLFIFMTSFFDSRRIVYYAVELVQAEGRRL